MKRWRVVIEFETDAPAALIEEISEDMFVQLGDARG